MENEIVKTNNQGIVSSTQEDCGAIASKYLSLVGQKIPPKVAYEFTQVARQQNLNPLNHEIYLVGYGDNWNVITDYKQYIRRANATGLLDGWECEVQGKGDDMTATCVINRKDWKHPFKHTVYYSECVQTTRDGKPNRMWAKSPRFMLKKVCEAQAFRVCFPDSFAGLPYTEDEMPTGEEARPLQNVTVTDVPQEQTNQEPKAQQEVIASTQSLALDAQKEMTDEQELEQAKKCQVQLKAWVQKFRAQLDVNQKTGNPLAIINNALEGNNREVIECFARVQKFLQLKHLI